MQITTKFNVGDKVYFMYNNGITEMSIIRVEVSYAGGGMTFIKYTGNIFDCDDSHKSVQADECNLFENVDSLLDYLKDNIRAYNIFEEPKF